MTTVVKPNPASAAGERDRCVENAARFPVIDERSSAMLPRDCPDRVAARERRASDERLSWFREAADRLTPAEIVEAMHDLLRRGGGGAWARGLHFLWAFEALDDADARTAAEYAFEKTRCGEPPPAFLALRDEARAWVEWASLAERRAYLSALLGFLDRDQTRTLARWLWNWK